ncbi:FAD-dependent thymidylate synthase [Salinispira pacifica]|nr:FAD-dependent thymidylate synthase [Salinispira pacifica]
MAHSVVEAAEQLLDKELPVLDKGFVRLVDYLGSDDRIVQAARVSYGPGTKSFRQDKGLIDYLLRNDHTSPFEQVILTFHTKMPVFVARQWVRHRTARLNEISGRYSVMKDEFYIPEGQNIALQSSDNKQGRMEDAVDPELQEEIRRELEDQQSAAYKAYTRLIDRGLARELARINLPLSMYTEWYWQIDLHNLFHFLRLRLDAHAQYEIRMYAERMLEAAEAVAPMAVESFRNHRLGGVNFTSAEQNVLRKVLGIPDTGSAAAGETWLERLPEHIRNIIEAEDMSGREKERLAVKILQGRQT